MEVRVLRWMMVRLMGGEFNGGTKVNKGEVNEAKVSGLR